jgi:GNAT superfamily N-acetyltransferase
MSISEQSQVAAGIRVRPFTDRDYDAVVAIENACFPDSPDTVAEWRYNDDHWDATKYVKLRYVAEEPTGQVVGYAGLQHVPWAFHPQKFSAAIRVHPTARRRGVGTRLWDQLLAELRARNAVIVRTMIRESMPEGVQFALRLGFHEVMRMWESRLDVASCDLAPYRDRVSRVLASGVAITSLAAELAKNPAILQRLYILTTAIGKDIPQPDEFTPPDYQLFLSYAVESPYALHDAFFIAVADGQLVGFSNLFKPELGDWLLQGTTGVLRPYRSRDIATALKVRTIEYAKAHGVREIRTWNETRNVGILAINDRFGFIRQPAWVHYEKSLEPGEQSALAGR